MAHRVLALRVPRLDHFPGHLLLQDEGGRRSTVGNKGRVIDFAQIFYMIMRLFSVAVVTRTALSRQRTSGTKISTYPIPGRTCEQNDWWSIWIYYGNLISLALRPTVTILTFHRLQLP